MTVQIHYGGLVYKMAEEDVEAEVVVGEISRGLREDDRAQQYTIATAEGLVTIFLNTGAAIAVIDVEEARSAYETHGLTVV